MAIPNSWKEVKLDKITSLMEKDNVTIIETDNLTVAQRILKNIRKYDIYFHRSDKRKTHGVYPYFKIVMVRQEGKSNNET